MMDYYSEFPPPSLEECKRQIVSQFECKVDDTCVMKAFENAKVLDVSGKKVKYSLAGWIYVKKDVVNELYKLISR
jgi:hypothetical protein